MAESQMLVKLDRDLVKRFKKRLIDNELTYKKWLEQRIREYLGEELGSKQVSHQ